MRVAFLKTCRSQQVDLVFDLEFEFSSKRRVRITCVIGLKNLNPAAKYRIYIWALSRAANRVCT